MNSFLYPVSSVGTVNFLEALAINQATAMNSLYGVPAIGSRRFLIRALSFTAKEHYSPELNFFATAAGLTTDPDTDTFLSRFAFDAAMGEQIAGAGLWRYYIDGLAIPYYDLDAANSLTPPTLHVVLQNLSATAKSANAAGSSVLHAWLEPMQAY